LSTPVTCTRRRASIKEIFALKEHVVNAYFECFQRYVACVWCRCCKVNRNVEKVDQDVARVAMIKYVCCKLMFQVFQVFSDVCCKCFIRMFQK
jgi:hypothetical protein